MSPPSKSFSVSWPLAVLHALDRYCERVKMRRATAIRQAVIELLSKAGFWPPVLAGSHHECAVRHGQKHS